MEFGCCLGTFQLSLYVITVLMHHIVRIIELPFRSQSDRTTLYHGGRRKRRTRGLFYWVSCAR